MRVAVQTCVLSLAMMLVVGLTPASAGGERPALGIAAGAGTATEMPFLIPASDRSPFILGRSNRQSGYTHPHRVRPYVTPRYPLGTRRPTLPSRCLSQVETRRGDRLVYSASCLDRRYRHASRLPGDCRARLRNTLGTRVIYEANCLARNGWRITRH